MRRLRKWVFLIVVVVILRIALIEVFNYANIWSSNYLEVEGETLTLTQSELDHLFTVKHDTRPNPLLQTLEVRSLTQQEFSLLINGLAYPHQILINRELVSQNVDPDRVGYDSDYAYKVFHINVGNYIDDRVEVSLVGNHQNRSKFLIGNVRRIDDARELRGAIHVVLLVFLVIGTILSLVMFWYNRNEIYFLLFFVMGLVSVFKTIVLGELFVVARVFGITANNYHLLDNLTSVINTIVPIFIVSHLLDIRIRPKHIRVGIAVFALMGFVTLRNDHSFLSFYLALFPLTFAITNVLMIIGYLRDKPFSQIILFAGVVYSSGAIYYLLVTTGVFSWGNLLVLINPAYLGAVLYMGTFFVAILLKHLKKVRTLEDQKREYDRISLLKGISHDLKLPLSVIKLNSQMMGKYDLTLEETHEYANISLEAARELEKMTENITSYLGMKELVEVGQTTSVRDCFAKLAHYYSANNRGGRCSFTVECADEDCMLEIEPLHFCRMLYNLIDNAFKYSNGDAKIVVRYQLEERLIVITVEDNGIGMDPTEIEKVFEPFYRVDYSGHVSGLGLGLSVVREVVSRLKGVIKVESERNVGTKIQLTIPR